MIANCKSALKAPFIMRTAEWINLLFFSFFVIVSWLRPLTSRRRDRFIQQAVMQVLQGRWDRTFSHSSYGFRPRRSAHQAVA